MVTKTIKENKLFIAYKLLKSKSIGNHMLFIAINYEELKEQDIKDIKANLTGVLKIKEHLINSTRDLLNLAWDVFVSDFWQTIEWIIQKDGLPVRTDRDERDISILFRGILHASRYKYPAFKYLIKNTSLAPVHPIVMNAFTANGQAENVMHLPMDYSLIDEYQYGRMTGKGRLIQDLFPGDIYPSWMREYLISGLTPEQWIELFVLNDGDDDEEDLQHIAEIV